jgi:hypothetical protein
MDDFSFIRENCNESKMFRNNYLSQLTLRDTVDSVFLNMITLYMLSKEFETRPFAQEYANRTMAFGNFAAPRVGGTDLYQGLHIMLYPNGHTASQLKAPEQNSALASQLHTNTKLVKEFLRGIANGALDRTTAIRIMYRLEGQMGIDISNYKSLRRLITDWENITTMQRQLCVTRLLQYYRLRGRHSELLPVLETLAKNKNMELTDVGNAELAAIGAGAVTGSRTGNGFMSGLAKAAGGFAVGYAIGRNL